MTTQDKTAKTYAVGLLHDVEMGPEIVAYVEGSDETLAPFGGRFIIHGGPVTELEGTWTGDLIVIEFPDRAAAEGWYDSPAYKAIVPLRTGYSNGVAILIDGVGEGHAATDILG